MQNALPTTNSIVSGQPYVVGGTSGTITYDAVVYNIGDEVEGTAASGYTVDSGDAFLTEQFRFYGTAIRAERHRDELVFNDELRFYGTSIGCIRQRDEFVFPDKLKFFGSSLTVTPTRYITTRRSVKGEE